MARKLPPDARDTLSSFFAEILFNIMVGMTKAESVEEAHGKLQAQLKDLTQARMRRVASLAGEYFVDHSQASPKKLTSQQIDRLKTEAIEFALAQLE